MYKTEISDRAWLIYDILGNLGWILYYIFIVLTVTQLHVFQETSFKIAMSVIEFICALGILVGLLELISERILKLDRVLPKVRLFRGFGYITVSSFIATIVSVMHFAILSKDGQPHMIYYLLMAIGAFRLLYIRSKDHLPRAVLKFVIMCPNGADKHRKL